MGHIPVVSLQRISKIIRSEEEKVETPTPDDTQLGFNLKVIIIKSLINKEEEFISLEFYKII